MCDSQWKKLSLPYNIERGHVWDNPKLPGDSGEVPFPNGVVGGSISAVKPSLYLTKKN